MTESQGGVERLGLFGGAFDPPHAAHHQLVDAAMAQLRLDRLLVIPTGQAWHKSATLSDAVHRVAMARLAFGDLPDVQVDTREIDRGGPSYSIDTLRALRAELGPVQLFLVLGQDQAQALNSWREWRQVVALATICVAERSEPASGNTRFMPPEGLHQRFIRLQLPVSATSATHIRALARSGQSIVPLVSDAVARYIVLHRLYQAH